MKKLVNEDLNEFLGIGDKKKFIENVKTDIQLLKKLKLEEQLLSWKLANAATNSLNNLNKIITRVLQNKNFTQRAEKVEGGKGETILVEIQKIRRNVKADKNGRNRAPNDFGATASNVYIGGENTYWTKTVAEYIEYFQSHPKDDERGPRLLGQQLYTWINSNIDALIWWLEVLIGIRK